MKQIFIDLHVTLEKAEKLVKECELERNGLAIIRTTMEEQWDEQIRRDEELRLREAVVLEVENILTLKQNARSLIEESSVRLNEAAMAEKSINNFIQKSKAEIGELKKAAEMELQNAKRAMAGVEIEVQKRVKSVLSKMNIEE